MNVLHVSPSFFPAITYGGTVRSGLGLCRGLAQLGCDVRVLTTNSNGIGLRLEVALDREVEVDGFRVVYCRKWTRNSVSPSLLRGLPSLVAWADIVHLTAVYSFPTFPTLLACRRSNKPLIWSPRGALQRWKNSSRAISKSVWQAVCRRLVCAHCTVLHVTSPEEAESAHMRIPGVRVSLVPNGVDLPPFINHIQSGTLRILYLGRLHPIKGIERLLEAVAILNTLTPSWSLRIAGSGTSSYISSLRSKVRQLQLSANVEFVGEVGEEAKAGLFAETDITIAPSYSENFCIVVAESLAHGVPVIASKGTPWSGLESHGCGLWVENDSPSLASAICKMRFMPLREMGRLGRRWMGQEFSWASVSRRMFSLYRESLCLQESEALALKSLG